MRIFVVFLSVLITFNSFGFFDRMHKFFDFDESKYSFEYGLEPFENFYLGFNVFYKGFMLEIINRNFGEFEVIDEKKRVLNHTYLYDIVSSFGYFNKVFENWFFGFLVSGKYEYYFIFSDITLSSKVGVGFFDSKVYFFNSFILDSIVGIEGIFRYSFDKTVDIGVGYYVVSYYQDFYVFMSTRIFQYQDVLMRVNTGVYYGTLKDLSSFIKVLFGYNSLSFGYGVLVHSFGIFQNFSVELRI